jgi:short-subunit dehydrogenase
LSLTEPRRFARKVVLITGASSGIGLAAAKAFAREGASLMLSARRKDLLDQASVACRKLGASCENFPADIQDHKQVLQLVEQTISQFGRIDVLINNAGIGFYSPFQKEPWENIARSLHTNFEAVLALCHAVVPHMLKLGSGSIVNVSSVVGKRPVAMLAAYSATKFGLWGFSQCLDLELRPLGIHVCHFCPTSTETEFHRLAGMETPGQPSGAKHSADRVANAMVDAVLKRKREHIMSITERVLIKCYLIAPGFTEGLLSLARGKGQSPKDGSHLEAAR